MDDEFSFAAMHPTAGYLFTEELDIHFLELDDFHSVLLQDPAVESAFSFTQPTPAPGCASPSSPSSVVYLPPCEKLTDDYPPCIKQEFSLFTTRNDYDEALIKLEPTHEFKYMHPPCTESNCPQDVIHDDPTSDEDKERLRRRQRGYEKRYRGRKRNDLKMQRDVWLALEMQLDAIRQKLCRPYVRVEQGGRETLRYKLLLLKLEERALQQDQVAMRSLQTWEKISRIREYSDKDQLRSVSEWQHSADKVIGRCAVLGPRRFHPYAPMEQRHFTW